MPTTIKCNSKSVHNTLFLIYYSYILTTFDVNLLSSKYIFLRTECHLIQKKYYMVMQLNLFEHDIAVYHLIKFKYLDFYVCLQNLIVFESIRTLEKG